MKRIYKVSSHFEKEDYVVASSYHMAARIAEEKIKTHINNIEVLRAEAVYEEDNMSSLLIKQKEESEKRISKLESNIKEVLNILVKDSTRYASALRKRMRLSYDILEATLNEQDDLYIRSLIEKIDDV